MPPEPFAAYCLCYSGAGLSFGEGEVGVFQSARATATLANPPAVEAIGPGWYIPTAAATRSHPRIVDPTGITLRMALCG